MKTLLRRAFTAVTGAPRARLARVVGATFALALAWSFVTVAAATEFFVRPAPFTAVLNAMLPMQFNAFAVLVALCVADHVVPAHRPMAGYYGVAIVAGVVVGTTALWIVSQHVMALGTAYAGAMLEPYAPFAFRHGSHALVVCGMFAAVYLSARRARQRLAALRQVQLQRAGDEQRLAQAALAAAHARVDPVVLQAALTRIDALYSTQPGAAHALLDDLIVALRAAIPADPGMRPGVP